MVVMAILGSALARILINNSRFVSRQDAMLSARESARAAMNTMLAELRGVSNGGVIAVARDSVRVRVPVAFGVLCRTVPPNTIASLMPYDSAMYAGAALEGVAWLDDLGNYNFVTGVISITGSSSQTTCDQDSIKVIPGGQLVAISRPNLGQPGRLFYLYQTVTYRFGNSADMPGRRALWRRAGNAAAEEIVAPFDTAASFRFLLGPRLTPSSTVPAVLDSVRGLQIRLVGASDYTPQGESRYQTFDMTTHVAFLNQR